MHINELLSENQIDELSLGDVGRGIEKGIGGLAKGVGYVAGIPGGIAQKFQQGKARATAGIGGTMAQQPAPEKQPNPAYTQALQNYQQYGTATAPAADAKAIRDQITQKQKELSALQAQLKTASTQKPTTQTPPATSGTAMPTNSFQVPGAVTPTLKQPATATKPATSGTAMPTNSFQVPGAVTPKLKVQPGGKTPAATQAEIDADRERMATGTNESTKFYSKFLGTMI